MSKRSTQELMKPNSMNGYWLTMEKLKIQAAFPLNQID